MDAPDGGLPHGGLVRDDSGNLFSTTSAGGSFGNGTVFEIQHGSDTIIPLASFNGTNGANPQAGVIEDSNGNLFGTTYQGGAFNLGTVFELKQGSGMITTLATFNGTNGGLPWDALVEDSSGNLFGTTSYNTVFELQLGSGTITTLATFDGTNGGDPVAGLVLDRSGNLFGTTLSTVFEVQAGSGTITTLAVLNGTSGAFLLGGVVEDSSGNLFGTTDGVSNNGIVFEVRNGSGTITTLATFNGTNGFDAQGALIEDSSGNLFGTTEHGGIGFNPSNSLSGYGTVFEVQQGSGTITTLASFNNANGTAPQAGLIEDNSGNLFGTTYRGASEGTVFEVQQGSGTITTLAAFHGSTGYAPTAIVQDSNGNLFSTAGYGGFFGDGTIIELQKDSGTITVLAAFNGANGGLPNSLVEDGDGNLFGTTFQGGPFDAGTVFEVKQGSGAITTVGTFDGLNGANPGRHLVLDSNGNLFGVTTNGGIGYTGRFTGYGTVFEVQQDSGTITTMATFNGTDSSNPGGGLIEDGSGNFFGCTVNGAPGSFGTAFEVRSGSRTITTLATFTISNAAPVGSLVEDGSGNLFGTTDQGGASFLGTVYEVKQGSGSVTTLASFDGTNGRDPISGLIVDSSGNLFGTAPGGGASSDGTVFEVPNGRGTIRVLASFNSANGAGPLYGPIEDSNGNLFGTTTAGGTSNDGTIFEVPGPPAIVTASISDWTINYPGYKQNLSASGGTGPYTFTVTGGTLSSGMTLGNGGVLAGTPTTAGSYTFTVTVTDTAGGSASQAYTVVINPAVAIITPSLVSGSAGSAYSQVIRASGGTAPLTFSTSGGALPPGLILTSDGTLRGTPTAAGSYNFTLMATDSVGANAGQSYTLTIAPGPFARYVVSDSGTSTLQAGSGLLVIVQAADANGNPITSYGGPASVTVSVSPATAAGSFPATVALNGSGLGFFLASLQKVGTYTISVMGSAFGGSANPVTVTPGPTVKLAFAAKPADTATGDVLPPVVVQVQDLYGNGVTSDNSDTVSLSVASGPGSFTAGSATTAPVVNGVATFNNLTLAVAGNYTLRELVSGKYTGPNSAVFTVTPLQVLPRSFAGTPSGFSLQFNAPFLVNSVTPVLFGQGFGATVLVPSVTLTQAMDGSGNVVNNLIAGSLVLNTATNSITFVATNTTLQVNNGSPILPDGTYTVAVHGTASTNGFQAIGSGGGFLDGLGSGTAGSGDYTATFTVNAAAAHDDVLWVPATADGPGQALNAPGNNHSVGGYPVYLSAGASNVTSVTLTLNYNPALLTVTGVTGAGLLLLGSSAPGHANLQYSGPALAAGSQTPIGFITATVPSGTVPSPMPYKAKDLLHLSGVSINAGAIPAATSDALHLVAYVADADGNGLYNDNDAVLITRALLNTDSGFAAYPLVDPVIVVDTDGAGFIPADAALQANEAGVGFLAPNLSTPPIPPGVHFTPIANNVDPSVSLPSDLHVGADGTVTVPVNIDNAHPEGSTGLTEGHLALTYDPYLFTVSAADVHLGSVLAAGSGWTLVPTINPVAGEIAITISSTTPIISTLGGSLVTIDFHPIDIGEPNGVNRRVPGQAPIELVASVNPSGQQVVLTELEDAQGTFTLTPAPTNGFDPRIDSVVFLTATPTAASPSNAMQVATTQEQGADAPRSPGEESHPAEVPVLATPAPSLAIPAPESIGQDQVAGPATLTDTAVLHVSAVSVHGAAASVVASSSLGTLSGAPLKDLIFQVGGLSALTGGGAAGTTAGPHLADSLIPSPVRWTNTLDTILVITVNDAIERVLADSWPRASSVADDLNWNETDWNLDWHRLAESRGTRDEGRKARGESIVNQAAAPEPLQRAPVDRAALDRYFAQTTDGTDQTMDNE